MKGWQGSVLLTPGQVDGGVDNEAEARLVLVGCVSTNGMDGNVWVRQGESVLFQAILHPRHMAAQGNSFMSVSASNLMPPKEPTTIISLLDTRGVKIVT